MCGSTSVQNSVNLLHETPGVQETCTQVTYLKDQFIQSHEDPHVMYRIDAVLYISTAAHASTYYGLTSFLFLYSHFYTYFFYILHLYIYILTYTSLRQYFYV
jgi:hypothetical protein